MDVGRAEGYSHLCLATAYASARNIGRDFNRSGWEAVSFEGQDIGEDEMVHIIDERYRMRLPLPVLGVQQHPVEQVCSRRMWNGADGDVLGMVTGMGMEKMR